MSAKRYTFSSHALEEAERRQIPRAVMDTVMEAPQQIVSGQPPRQIYQSQVTFPDGKVFLVRLIVEEQRVITVYRTSKIEKYWRAD